MRFEIKAEVAQLVEHHLAKVGVAGPSPVFRSIYFKPRQFLKHESESFIVQRIHEPKGSLTIPPLRVTPNARQRAQHVKGVTKDDVKTQGKNAEIFVSGKEERSGSPETYSCTSRSGREALTQHDAKRSSFSWRV